MDQSPSNESSQTISRTTGSPTWVCLVVGAVMTTALALAAAHSPPRIRLIGLFSIAFGLIVGWSLTLLAEKMDCHLSRRALGIAVAAFTMIGLIGSNWETVRLNEAQKPKSGTDTVAERLIEQMKLQSKSGDPDGNIAIPSAASPSPLIVFQRYLSRRLRPLGEWSSPWPEAFWCLELCAAAAVSAWIATRRRSLTRAF